MENFVFSANIISWIFKISLKMNNKYKQSWHKEKGDSPLCTIHLCTLLCYSRSKENIWLKKEID